MKLLFIQGGSRWKYDNKHNIYTDANFNMQIWDRYIGLCDHLTVILREEDCIYDEAEARERFNLFDPSQARSVGVPDLYAPIGHFFDLHLRNKAEKTIREEVSGADKVIIRSLGNFYTNTALKYAKKFGVDCLVEVTGFALEGSWYHSLKGKLVCLFRELSLVKNIRSAQYALYVTQEALQKRYPCDGNVLGCSDVEIQKITQEVRNRRKYRIEEKRDRLIIGTAAFLDVRWKGQECVIQAVSSLKKRYPEKRIEYHMIGAGTGDRLKRSAADLQVEDQIFFDGAIPHDKVFEWLDQIDVYIQPSFQEGLCRSIVEAMSRGCPVIASDVGGNYELVPRECLFHKGDADQLAELILRSSQEDFQSDYSEKSFDRALEFESEGLEKKRMQFYTDFINHRKTECT